MRGRRVLLAALAALAAAALANFCLGASGVSVPDMARAVFAGDRESVAARVFFYVRLPRAAAAAVAGSALAVATPLGFVGVCLANPLAWGLALCYCIGMTTHFLRRRESAAQTS